MTKGEIVEYSVVIDIKYREILQMSKINITNLKIYKLNSARWILLKVLLLDV
jgi:hypothetical protein